MNEKQNKHWLSHSRSRRAKTAKKPKRPKRGNALKRWLEHERRVKGAAGRAAQHDRLAKGHWAKPSMKELIRIVRVVSGGLPSLGKRR
jgi:hypothetical protein